MQITLTLPPEFVGLCRDTGVTPEDALRAFVADVTGIQSWSSDPREDGYSSNGGDERLLAREYWERAHGGVKS